MSYKKKLTTKTKERREKTQHIYICAGRMDVNRIKRELSSNKKSEVVHLLHTPLERAGDKIGEQRPGSFPKYEMPGTANFLFVAVEPQVDELGNKIQPKLIGVSVGTMFFNGQGGEEQESTLLLDPGTPGV